MGATPLDVEGFNSASAQAAAQPNVPVDEVCIPCVSDFRVEAHYDDPWKTPLAQKSLLIEYTDGTLIDAGGETLGVRSFGQEDGRVTNDIRPDLGSYEGRAPYAGLIVARIEPEEGPDPATLEAEIVSDLEGFAKEMQTAMAPWITEWESSGWLGFFSSLWSGLLDGLGAWW